MNISLLIIDYGEVLDKQSYILNPMDIYYIETIDNKVFAYTKNKVYELSYKLYVLETILPTKYFF